MIYIKTEMLAFQVTRRCNQVCDHCCKGKMQQIDMTKELIDTLFVHNDYMISEITHLAITGGEPTLVPDIVEYLIDTIINKQIMITKHVNVFTNGLIYNDSFIHSLYKLIVYLKKHPKCKNTSINVKLSNDQFHQTIPNEVLEKYRKVPFISEEWLHPFVLKESEIQNDGNAKDNHLGGTFDTSYIPSINYISKKQNRIEIKNGLFISANGNVVNEKHGCATFVNEDKLAYGNLFDQSFLEIIDQFQHLT